MDSETCSVGSDGASEADGGFANTPAYKPEGFEGATGFVLRAVSFP